MNGHITKIALLLFSLILFQGCSQSDPLGEVEFGKKSVVEFKEDFLTKGILETLVINDEVYDTVLFYTLDEESQLKVPLWTNTDIYDFDTLYSFKLNFGSDSTLSFDKRVYSPRIGNFSQERLDLVIKIYKEWYGEPDYTGQSAIKYNSLINDYLEPNKAEEKENKKKEAPPLPIDLRNFGKIGKCCEHYLVWELENYRVMIYYTSIFSTGGSYRNGFIKYEDLNYENKIYDRYIFIRMNASTNDYISMRLYLDPFTEAEFPYSDQLNLVVYDVGHNLLEEPRSIRKFKFDVTYEDEYGDEILNSEGLQITNDLNLEFPRNGVSTSLSSNFLFKAYFNRNAPGYEKLRLMRESNNTKPYRSGIIIKYRITHIIFEDGEILKSDAQTGFVESK